METTVRVLVTSTAGTGHIHPLVPLASELQAAGHDVLWAIAAESCAQVKRYGFRAMSVGTGAKEEVARLFAEREGPEQMLELPIRERREVMLPIFFGEIVARWMRDGLVNIFDSFRPDLVVHDLCEFAAAPLAARRGIPHAAVAFGAALSPGLISAVSASTTPMWESEGLVPSPSAGLYDHLYLHPLPTGLGEPLNTATARSIRPMHFDGASVTEAPDWVEKFGRSRSGIYVTFGTEMAARAPWAAIVEALGSLDAEAVVTLGSAIDPATLGSPLPNVRVEKYVPQAFILDHAKVVVSHAGSGTLFAAAARGIPQLCVPIAADQWDNSDALTAAGAAITLELDQRSVDDIRQAMLRLLDEPAYAAAAHSLALDFAALPHPRDHVATLEQLI